MIREGKVIANPSIGREQTYSMGQEARPVSEFFINQFWKNSDSLCQLCASRELARTFYEFCSLARTWPEMYEKLKKDFDKVEFHLNLVPYFRSSSIIQNSSLRSAWLEDSVIRDSIENLTAKVSMFLHEQFEKVKKQKKQGKQ